MSEVNAFCKTLRDAHRGRQFGSFLKQLRERRWKSQQAMQLDPVVVQVCASTGVDPRSLVRIMGRIMQDGRTSPKNVRRLAQIFGYDTPEKFIESFQQWTRGAA